MYTVNKMITRKDTQYYSVLNGTLLPQKSDNYCIQAHETFVKL